MSTENEVIEDVVEVAEIVPTMDDQGNDTTDWKAIAEQRQADAIKNQGIAKRFKTKLEKSKEVKATATPAPKSDAPKSEGFGYAEKAFLVANGVKGADEIGLVEKAMKSSGDTLEQVLENEFFQGKLKTLRDTKAAAVAVPTGPKRSGAPGATDNVEYWSEKYNSGTQLADIPDEWQIKVLNAKIAKEKSSGSNFSKNPIISG